jgi:hypothetical protein
MANTKRYLTTWAQKYAFLIRAMWAGARRRRRRRLGKRMHARTCETAGCAASNISTHRRARTAVLRGYSDFATLHHSTLHYTTLHHTTPKNPPTADMRWKIDIVSASACPYPPPNQHQCQNSSVLTCRVNMPEQTSRARQRERNKGHLAACRRFRFASRMFQRQAPWGAEVR